MLQAQRSDRVAPLMSTSSAGMMPTAQPSTVPPAPIQLLSPGLFQTIRAAQPLITMIPRARRSSSTVTALLPRRRLMLLPDRGLFAVSLHGGAAL